ncbi:hypothetical protein M5689_000229 [Euphorbia peplus]|nr:hypothetical protein M5689_000229 [Euphorbia peplus]
MTFTKDEFNEITTNKLHQDELETSHNVGYDDSSNPEEWLSLSLGGNGDGNSISTQGARGSSKCSQRRENWPMNAPKHTDPGG